MKKYLLIIGCLFLLSACGEDETVDITVMPEATATGAGTFGCLVDGWVYVGGRYPQNIIWYVPSVQFTYWGGRMQASAQVKADRRLAFDLLAPEEGKECTISNVTWDGEDLPGGTALISRMDTANHIISGTFQAGDGLITEGRFDVVYDRPDGEER